MFHVTGMSGFEILFVLVIKGDNCISAKHMSATNTVVTSIQFITYSEEDIF